MENSTNSLLESKRYLIEKRGIAQQTLTLLESKWLVSFANHEVKFLMRSIHGKSLGNKIRYTDGRIPKSKNESGSHAWIFYVDIDFDRPILITEWEIDRMTGLAYYDNTIGLSSVAITKSVIKTLQEASRQCHIYLLIDNDNPADKTVNSIIDDDGINKEYIFDARPILRTYKDINEYYTNGGKIAMPIIEEESVCLQKIVDTAIDYFLWKGDDLYSIDCCKCAEYLKRKEDIAYAFGILYKHSNDKWIWEVKNKEELERMLINNIKSDLKMLGQQEFPIRRSLIRDIMEFLPSTSLNENMQDALGKKDSYDICLAEEILDVRSFESRKYSKTEYKTHKFNFSFDKLFETNEKPIHFLEFLESILEWYSDKDGIITFLQEYIGYLFLPTAKFEKSLFLYGTWANGKGVLLDVIAHLIWTENYSNIWLHEINKDQNIYLLLGKLVNIDYDMQQQVQLDSGNIKKIISWEGLIAKPLYRQPIKMAPTVRFVIASNSLPRLETIDYSISRRFVFLELKKSFKDKEDFDLKDKLKEESNDIFAWAIQGLRTLLGRGRFNIPKELEANIKEFVDEQDTIQQFIDGWDLKLSKNSWMSNTDIYQRYKIFCEHNGYAKLSNVTFFKELKKKWFKDHKQWNERGYYGFDYLDINER